MKRILALSLLAWSALVSLTWSATPEERKEYTDKWVKTVPTVASFNQWLARTGESVPDFDALPKSNALPDPLTFLDGRKVKNAEDWKARRAEIIKLAQMYDIGTMPPKPKIDSIVPVEAGAGGMAGRMGRGGTPAPGSTTKVVDLKYGPDSAITTRVTLNIPPGDGPFPVMIGGSVAGRTYITCSFPNSVDQPPDIGKYYPECDWGSMAKCAWITQVVVDYLYTIPQVDKKCIAITGFSRDGKKALIAAALEERITAAVPGSTGVGGAMPWRDGSERGFGESIESTTRNFPLWFTPRLRFFSGREDRLPVDANLFIALVAPRACLITYGNNDEVAQPWPMENAYKSALKAYELLGKPEALGVIHSPGYHGAQDQAGVANWLDYQFGKSQNKWVNDFVYPWDYDKWNGQVKDSVDLSKYPARKLTDTLAGAGGATIASTGDWEKKSAEVRKSVEWMLGDKTAGTLASPFALPKLGDPSQPAASRGGRGMGAMAMGMMGMGGRTLFDDIHGTKAQGGSYGIVGAALQQTTKRKVSFASNSGFGTIEADIFTPRSASSGAKMPAVIWLHGYSSSLGYSWVYHFESHPVLGLAAAGYTVLAFDQSGYGSRQVEAASFYNKYPKWSQMGHMVEDVRAAIDLLSKDPTVDPERIYLFGYSMGANLAVHTAVLDPRVKGVALLNGITPMRVDTEDKGAGGIARYYREHDLLPRMGAFAGKEAQLPYDFDELIGALAPRPVYILAPQFDRDATPADVRTTVEQAKKVYALYGAAEKVKIDEPWDYNRLTLSMQDRVIAWMKENMK